VWGQHLALFHIVDLIYYGESLFIKDLLDICITRPFPPQRKPSSAARSISQVSARQRWAPQTSDPSILFCSDLGPHSLFLWCSRFAIPFHFPGGEDQRVSLAGFLFCLLRIQEIPQTKVWIPPMCSWFPQIHLLPYFNCELPHCGPMDFRPQISWVVVVGQSPSGWFREIRCGFVAARLAVRQKDSSCALA
jgi:hypothetical protein